MTLQLSKELSITIGRRSGGVTILLESADQPAISVVITGVEADCLATALKHYAKAADHD